MKYIMAVLIFVLLAGCDQPVVNQCMRLELFNNCMDRLPDGPDNTKYNDWDDVVSECSNVARLLSYRQKQFITQECRA